MQPPELPDPAGSLSRGPVRRTLNAVQPCLRKRFVCIRLHKLGGTGNVL